MEISYMARLAPAAVDAMMWLQNTLAADLWDSQHGISASGI
jgi:hypothetical protein